ncbi:MAG: TetR/AcrR family transcriptional regulator [Planctomycetota bacterium]|jgi:AcrR family transcriptional regulator
MNSVRRRRASKADWFEIALRVLGEEGVQAVRVERLARELGIARSGFYWHFKSRQDLRNQLLDYWAHEYTEILSDNPEVRALHPRARLTRIAEIVLEHDLSGYDRAFRTWANFDAEVARRFRRVIGTRLDYIRATFAELGFEGQELEMRARVFVAYEMVQPSLYGHMSKKKLRALIPHRIEMITRR